MNVTTLNDNATSDSTTTMPTMAGETGLQLRDRRGDKPRNIERRWKRHFGEAFSVFETYDSDMIATYEALYPVDAKKSAGEKITKRTSTVRNKAGETPESNVVPANLSKGKKWLLWACLSLSLGCSIPNMLSIMEAIKGDEKQAIVLTAAFTIAPFLLIGYGVRGFLHAVVYIVICVEIFCNAAGFYGGMTGLSHSLYTAPTMFLHMVTSMTNSGNEGTALLLAVCMAVCIALLAVVPVYEIGKTFKK